MLSLWKDSERRCENGFWMWSGKLLVPVRRRIVSKSILPLARTVEIQILLQMQLLLLLLNWCKLWDKGLRLGSLNNLQSLGVVICFVKGQIKKYFRLCEPRHNWSQLQKSSVGVGRHRGTVCTMAGAVAFLKATSRQLPF